MESEQGGDVAGRLKTLYRTSNKERTMEVLGICSAAITMGMLGLWVAAV